MIRHRAWTEVDLSAVSHNYQQIRRRLAASTKVLAVLKANAYGHGAVEVAHTLSAEGVDAIGLGNVEEGVELRKNGVRTPLLVLGAIFPDEAEEAVRYGIQVNVGSIDTVRELEAAAKSLGKAAHVHLLVDTGMGRLGVQPEDVVRLAKQIDAMQSVQLIGICTHLSSAGEAGGQYSQLQLSRFRMAVQSLAMEGITGLIAHAASHTALLKFPDAQFDMVRPGLALYGLTGAKFDPINTELKRVLTLKSRIIHVKDIEANTPVSYSRLWTSDRATKIATLAIGYNDGIPVALTNRAEVLVRGRRCRMVGRISMDYVMVDVGHIPGIKAGDEVTLIGKDGDEEIRIEDIAAMIGTVPYELSCKIGTRVKREYVGAVEREESERTLTIARQVG